MNRFQMISCNKFQKTAFYRLLTCLKYYQNDSNEQISVKSKKKSKMNRFQGMTEMSRF